MAAEKRKPPILSPAQTLSTRPTHAPTPGGCAAICLPGAGRIATGALSTQNNKAKGARGRPFVCLACGKTGTGRGCGAGAVVGFLLTALCVRHTMDSLAFGGVPKRSTGADCKSAGSAFEGSNPSPSTNTMPEAAVACAPEGLRKIAGVAQLVEHLPSKQDVASSNLVARSSAPVGV